MKRPMSVELLEQNHEFPGPYMFKVIGECTERFIARVIAEVRDELQATADPPFRVRESVGGRHVAVTLEPTVNSAQQVLAIYSRIGQLDGLVMLI